MPVRQLRPDEKHRRQYGVRLLQPDERAQVDDTPKVTVYGVSAVVEPSALRLGQEATLSVSVRDGECNCLVDAELTTTLTDPAGAVVDLGQVHDAKGVYHAVVTPQAIGMHVVSVGVAGQGPTIRLQVRD